MKKRITCGWERIRCPWVLDNLYVYIYPLDPLPYFPQRGHNRNTHFFPLSRSFSVFSARQAGCPKKWPISSPMTRSPSSRRPLAYSTRTAMVSFLLYPFFFPRFPSLFLLYFILFLWIYLQILDPFFVFYYESTNCSFGFYVCMFLLEFLVVDLGFSLGFGFL